MTSARVHCCISGEPKQYSKTNARMFGHMRISSTMALLHFSCLHLHVCTLICDNRCLCVCCSALVVIYPSQISTLLYVWARNSPMRLIVRSDGGHTHILFFVFGPPPSPVARNRATFCSSSLTHKAIHTLILARLQPNTHTWLGSSTYVCRCACTAAPSSFGPLVRWGFTTALYLAQAVSAVRVYQYSLRTFKLHESKANSSTCES